MANVFYADISKDLVNKRLNLLFRRRGPEYTYRYRPGHARIYPGEIDISDEGDSSRRPVFSQIVAEDASKISPFLLYVAYPPILELVLSLQKLSSDMPVDAPTHTRKLALESAESYETGRNTPSSIDNKEASELDEAVFNQNDLRKQL